MTTTTPITDVCEPIISTRVQSQRGVAMLLVVFAMGIGSVLALTFLTSKSNSSHIGENVASATASSWSAKAAADIGVAILQTSLDWRTQAAGGVLMNTQTIAGGNAIVTLTNLTGQPPTATDREVIMTVTSTVNGIPSTVQRIVQVPPPPPVGVVDLGLNEFTIFASNGLTVGSNAGVAVWSKSPEALTTQPMKIGVGFNAASSLVLDPSATILRSELYTPSTASVGLQSYLTSSVFTGGAVLPLSVPALSWNIPIGFTALPPIGTDTVISGQAMTLAPGAYQNVLITNGSTVIIDAALGAYYSFTDLKIEKGSVVTIKGDVKLWMKDDLRIKGLSALELGTSTARLTAYIYDNVTVSDSSVGFDRSVGFDQNRSRNDPHKYIDPRRISIRCEYRTAPDADPTDDGEDEDLMSGDMNSGALDIRLKKNSLVVASFQTPGAKAQIKDGSTLYGRITARQIDLNSFGAVLGDPTLDNNAGFATLNSSLYDTFGNMIPALASALASIIPSLGVVTIQANIETLLAGAIVPPPAPPAPANGGTPRLAARAVARGWPVAVMAMEVNTPPDPTQFNGSYLTVLLEGYDSTNSSTWWNLSNKGAMGAWP